MNLFYIFIHLTKVNYDFHDAEKTEESQNPVIKMLFTVKGGISFNLATSGPINQK